MDPLFQQPQEQPVQKHICGVCHDEWLSEEEYLNHVCPQTGAQPTQPEHLINSTTPEFAAIQAAALQRGTDTQPPIVEIPPAYPQ